MDDVQLKHTINDDAPAAVEMEQRLERITCVLILLASVIAAVFAAWKMALGIALGGALSLFNARWLSTSTKTIIEFASGTGNPQAPRVAKFFLRLLVVGVVIFIAAKTGLFPLLGIGIGFTAYVVAAIIEAFYQAVKLHSSS